MSPCIPPPPAAAAAYTTSITHLPDGRPILYWGKTDRHVPGSPIIIIDTHFICSPPPAKFSSRKIRLPGK